MNHCFICGQTVFLVAIEDNSICEKCLHTGLRGLVTPWKKMFEALLEDYKMYCHKSISSDDPEDVHQARVVGRKIRALLQFLCVPKNHHLLTSVKKVHKLLNTVRESDVLLHEMGKHRKDSPMYDEICKRVEKKQRRRKSLLANNIPAILDSEFEKDTENFLELELKHYVINCDKGTTISRWNERFQHVVNTYHQSVKKHGKTDPKTVTALHAVRIHSKSIRYIYHFFAEAFDEGFKEQENKYKELQNQFGDINDVQDWLHQVEHYQNKLHVKRRDIDDIKHKLQTRLTHLVEKVDLPKYE